MYSFDVVNSRYIAGKIAKKFNTENFSSSIYNNLKLINLNRLHYNISNASR